MKKAVVATVWSLAACCHSATAPAQTVDLMQLYYDGGRPYVRLEGTANAWFPTLSDVVVETEGRTVSIRLCNTSWFSTTTPWDLSVPLNLPRTAIYNIGVYLQCGGPERVMVGYLTTWVEGGFDPIFASTFE